MTAEESLYTGAVTDIAAFIKACNFPNDSYVLVERQPKTIIPDEERQNLLRFVRLHDNVDIASYTSGRIFHQDFELRWEHDAVVAGKISVVYIGIKRDLPGLIESKLTLQPLENEQQKGKDRHYYLFGERLSQERLAAMGLEPGEDYLYYAETRIPRLLIYPKLAGGEHYERLQVAVREYRLIDPVRGDEHGSVYRFIGLKPVELAEVKQ
jgi:hypothetical protein